MKKLLTIIICVCITYCICAADMLSEKDAAYWIWFDSSRSHTFRKNPKITTADMCLYGAFNMAEIQHLSGHRLTTDASTGITVLHIAALTGDYSVIEKYKSFVNKTDAMGRTPIFYAKNQRTIELLIENGAAASPTDNYGFTPLFIARNLECAETLIEKGCSVTARSRSENTPLHITGNKDIAIFLSKKNAAIIAKNINGETPLHIQIKYEDNSDIIKWLITATDKDVVECDNEGNTALHYVTRLELAELIFNRNNNIIHVKNKKGETPIFTTTSAEIGRFLIEKGCSLNIKNNPQWDETPLHTAKNAKMVELLVQYIDVNSATSYGYTPLHSAENLNVANALISHGAKLNAQLADGRTPLHIHVKKNPAIALLLVEKGADVNIKTEYGFTPIFDVRSPELARKIAIKADKNLKVKYGRGEYTGLVWHFLKYADYPNDIKRCDVARAIVAGCPEMAKIPTNFGITPLHCVPNEPDAKTAKAILEAGADINAKNDTNKTPLHCKVQDGHYDVARFLIENGADLNAIDKEGKTPLAYCKDAEFSEYMKSKGASIPPNAK